MDELRALQLALGYWPARAFSAAGELGVYELLAATGPLDSATIARGLDIRSRSFPHLLDALVELGVLTRIDGRYSLADDAPDGEILAMGDTASMHAWAELPAVLREGRRSGPSIYEEVAADPDRLEAFVDLMSRVSVPAHVAVAELDYAAGEVVCDVGGADGRLAAVIAGLHPEVRCVTFDLPAFVPLAEAQARHAGVADRVTVVGADFFVDPLPRADVLVLSLVLLDWDIEQKHQLLRNCRDAVRPDGRLVIVERFDDVGDEAPKSSFDLLRSLHFLALLGEAYTFRAADLDAWLGEIDFRVDDRQALQDGFTLLVARRRTE